MPAHTYIGFRNRPIDPTVAVANQISRSLRGGRSYQRQHLTLTDAYVSQSVAVGSSTATSHVVLQPGDLVVSATVTVPTNSAATTFDVAINGTLRGSSLGGTWSIVPTIIDFKQYATPNASGAPFSAVTVSLKNVSGSTSTLEFQVVIVVLR